MESVAAIVMAAGKGTRMRSALPKVVHPCGGVPLVAHAVRAAHAAGAHPVVVVVGKESHPLVRDALVEHAPKIEVRFAIQDPPCGTGDAVRCGLVALEAAGVQASQRIWILSGDTPLVRPETLQRLTEVDAKHPVAFLTAIVDGECAYGRVLREGDIALRVVEFKDATQEERAIREVNAGIYLARCDVLAHAVNNFDSDNAQGEFYLTDLICAVWEQGGAAPVLLDDAGEVQGVNTRADLAMCEDVLRRRMIAKAQALGVGMRDPSTVYLDADVELASDVMLGPGVQLYGRCVIGAGAHIEGPAVLISSTVDAGARVMAFSHLELAHVGAEASIGPLARLRPKTEVGEGAKVGNFVELKNAKLEPGAKAGHLAYLGDVHIGAKSNVGAGTITCNYDGVAKHHTEIGEGAFVGSNTTLVAPIVLGRGAYVAAGSTLTQDVSADALAFGRARQCERAGHAASLRARQAHKAGKVSQADKNSNEIPTKNRSV